MKLNHYPAAYLTFARNLSPRVTSSSRGSDVDLQVENE
jgi:hypothetical protein